MYCGISPEDSGKGKGKASVKKSAVVGAPLPEQLFNGLPWVEKFRPASLGDLVAHDDIIAICTALSYTYYVYMSDSKEIGLGSGGEGRGQGCR